MKNLLPLLGLLLAAAVTGCNSSDANDNKSTAIETASKKDSVATPPPPRKMATAAEIISRRQVPILCYHHIRDIQMPSKAMNGYEVTVQQFKDQMKALADSGYKTITPGQLYDYLVYNAPIPEKPVMITYDDTDEEQFSIAKPEMDKYGFKGVYFIMTISIGRPRYMTKEQIRQLSDEGHYIGSHTWDHHRVDRYKLENEIEERGKKKIVNDWDQQLLNTKKKLEEITGKPVEHFAYPFGIWSAAGIPEIEKRGYKIAYQLSTQRDSAQPLYTVRRMIVSPTWTAAGMIRAMKSTFR